MVVLAQHAPIIEFYRIGRCVDSAVQIMVVWDAK